MKKLLLILFTILVSYALLYAGSITEVYAATPTVETRIADQSEKLTIEPIIKSISQNAAIEMWHYSGGYWKYNDLTVTDSQLKNNLEDADALAKAVNKEITFELNISSSNYADLMKRDKVIVYVSTTPDKKYSDLFYDKPSIELKDNKVYLKVMPKFNFYTGNYKNYSEFVSGLNVTIPIVNPDFGHNRYSIFGRTNSAG